MIYLQFITRYLPSEGAEWIAHQWSMVMMLKATRINIESFFKNSERYSDTESTTALSENSSQINPCELFTTQWVLYLLLNYNKHPGKYKVMCSRSLHKVNTLMKGTLTSRTAASQTTDTLLNYFPIATLHPRVTNIVTSSSIDHFLPILILKKRNPSAYTLCALILWLKTFLYYSSLL